MTVLIVIVSWNARMDLERCLASLVEAPPAIPHSVVVVDNASQDGSADMVANRFPAVRLIRSDENLGFARGNNLALRGAQSDLILLLNPDTIVAAGAIDALVGRLMAHPRAAAAGPRIIDGDGEPELSFGRMPTPLAEAGRKLLSRLYAARVPPFPALVRRVTARERMVDWVTGACLLVRRDPAEVVGFLDERYGLYWEDVDFCAALRAKGWSVLFTPAAQILHLRGRSAASAPTAANRAYRDAQLAFYMKHQPRWVPLLRWYQRLRYDGSRSFEL
jgi:N-acetylglucosaminyl-diphospho-decaprenol L-rhamnosyltransferase